MRKLFTLAAIVGLLAGAFGLSSALHSQILPAAFTSAQPTAASGNATTGRLMAGYGVTGAGGGFLITPVRTGKIEFVVEGNVQNSTANDGWAMDLWFAPVPAVAAPANGVAAPSGAIQCTPTSVLAGTMVTTGAEPWPFTLVCFASGLTVGTQYWYDVGYKAVTGGTVTLTNVQGFAAEQ